MMSTVIYRIKIKINMSQALFQSNRNRNKNLPAKFKDINEILRLCTFFPLIEKIYCKHHQLLKGCVSHLENFVASVKQLQHCMATN